MLGHTEVYLKFSVSMRSCSVGDSLGGYPVPSGEHSTMAHTAFRHSNE